MSSSTADTVRHPIFARLYQRISAAAEAAGAAEHRDRMLAGLTGRVVEVGAGNGLNFAHYPDTVTEVIAVEPETYLRTRATEAGAAARVAVTVVDGTADRVPLPDKSVDAGVGSLVLCSVPDQASALAELHRVIRPGGELRFYEHVAATAPRWAQWQRHVDPDPTGRRRRLSRALDHDSSRPVRVGEVSTIGHDGLPTAPPVG